MSNDTQNIEAKNAILKMGKDTSLLFIGTSIGILFNFIIRIILARMYTPEDYGLFNLYYSFLFLFSSIGTFGLMNGISRNISYFYGKNDIKKVNSIILLGIILGLFFGIIVGGILFISSYQFASKFSNNNIFILYLKIASLTIPFWVLLNILISVFRGFQRIKEKIIFFDILRNILFFVLIVFIGITSLSMTYVIFFNALSIIIPTFLLLLYFIYIKNSKLIKKSTIELGVIKTLLIFSIPLFLVDILQNVLTWIDTIMIGLLKTTEAVAHYNAAKPLGTFISLGLTVSLFIYIPLATKLYAIKDYKTMNITYVSITKWLSFITLPLFLTFFLLPKQIILLSFGSNYLQGAAVLRIISLAFFFNNLTGPNGATLTALGKVNFLMLASFATAILNILFNWLLIPLFGISGAAIATLFSMIIVNLIRILILYQKSGIHSIKLSIFKPIVFLIILFSVIIIPIQHFYELSLSLIGFVPIFIVSTLISIILFKSITKQDIEIIADFSNSIIKNKKGQKIISYFLKKLEIYIS